MCRLLSGVSTGEHPHINKGAGRAVLLVSLNCRCSILSYWIWQWVKIQIAAERAHASISPVNHRSINRQKNNPVRKIGLLPSLSWLLL